MADPPSLLQADAVRVLTAYQPSDPQQERTRLDLISHLAAHPDAVWKSGPPAHLTASCLVLDASLEHVLLTHHRRARQWFQFGGHLEPADRGVRAAAEREAREESGIDELRVSLTPVHLDRHRLVGDFGRCAEHLDIRYAATAPDGTLPTVSGESLDVRWWPASALPQDGGGLVQLVASARQALAGP
ncbi:MAG: NUDIX domain-containing protein [Lapillicoccus sp.]